MTEPLPTGIKAFNQRLLAEHSLPEKKAREVWEQLSTTYEMGTESMESGLARANAQLRHIGMEIVGISVRQEDGSFNRHFAMVNKHPDEVAKMVFQQSLSAEEHSYIRLVFEKLVEGTESRANLLNLKNGVEGAFKLENAEDSLQKLVDDKWLEEAPGNIRSGSMQAKIQFAPRTYSELSYLLVSEFGMEKENLPQLMFFS